MPAEEFEGEADAVIQWAKPLCVTLALGGGGLEEAHDCTGSALTAMAIWGINQ